MRALVLAVATASGVGWGCQPAARLPECEASVRSGPIRLWSSDAGVTAFAATTSSNGRTFAAWEEVGADGGATARSAEVASNGGGSTVSFNAIVVRERTGAQAALRTTAVGDELLVFRVTPVSDDPPADRVVVFALRLDGSEAEQGLGFIFPELGSPAARTSPAGEVLVAWNEPAVALDQPSGRMGAFDPSTLRMSQQARAFDWRRGSSAEFVVVDQALALVRIEEFVEGNASFNFQLIESARPGEAHRTAAIERWRAPVSFSASGASGVVYAAALLGQSGDFLSATWDTQGGPRARRQEPSFDVRNISISADDIGAWLMAAPNAGGHVDVRRLARDGEDATDWVRVSIPGTASHIAWVHHQDETVALIGGSAGITAVPLRCD